MKQTKSAKLICNQLNKGVLLWGCLQIIKRTHQLIFITKKQKKYLYQKHGFMHVLMINSFSKWTNQNFGVEDKYTTRINEILRGDARK